MKQTTDENNEARPDQGPVWALVLAAGMSERMGQQKLLLPFGNKTVIETVIDNIVVAGIDHILVVVGSHREEIEKALQGFPVVFCFNPHFRKGMHTSVICGFQHLPPSASAALVFLGDQPFTPPAVIKQLAGAWKKSGKQIVVPVWKGKRGHPTLFDLTLKKIILEMDPDAGLRSVLSDLSREIMEVQTNSPEITRDIDTKKDYLNELNLIKNRWKK